MRPPKRSPGSRRNRLALHAGMLPLVLSLCAVSAAARASDAPATALELHLPVTVAAGSTVRVDQILDEHYDLLLDDYLLAQLWVEADAPKRSRRSYAALTVGGRQLPRVPFSDHQTRIDVPLIRSTRWQLRLGPGQAAHGLRLVLLPRDDDALQAARGNERVFAGTVIHRQRYSIRDEWFWDPQFGYHSAGFDRRRSQWVRNRHRPQPFAHRPFVGQLPSQVPRRANRQRERGLTRAEERFRPGQVVRPDRPTVRPLQPSEPRRRQWRGARFGGEDTMQTSRRAAAERRVRGNTRVQSRTPRPRRAERAASRQPRAQPGYRPARPQQHLGRRTGSSRISRD